jgi:hypothetical protein
MPSSSSTLNQARGWERLLVTKHHVNSDNNFPQESCIYDPGMSLQS